MREIIFYEQDDLLDELDDIIVKIRKTFKKEDSFEKVSLKLMFLPNFRRLSEAILDSFIENMDKGRISSDVPIDYDDYTMESDELTLSYYGTLYNDKKEEAMFMLDFVIEYVLDLESHTAEIKIC